MQLSCVCFCFAYYCNSVAFKKKSMKLLLRQYLDSLGICTSLFCAIHCLVTSVLLIVLPFVGFSFLESKGFHIGMILCSFLLASVSFGISYFNYHRNFSAILLAVIGFVFFGLAQMASSETLEVGVSLIGGLFIIYAHLRNRKLNQQLSE